MKKFLSCCAAFSLALLACGDDSSSDSNGNHVSDGNHVSAGSNKNVDLRMVSKYKSMELLLVKSTPFWTCRDVLFIRVLPKYRILC